MLNMLTKLRLADLRQTTAHQRSTGQKRPSHLYLSGRLSRRRARDKKTVRHLMQDDR
jgi:hypothetical protein